MKSSFRIFSTTLLVIAGTVLLASIFSLSQIYHEAESQARIDMERRIKTFWELVKQKGDTFRVVDNKLLVGDYVLNGNYELPDKIQKIFGGTATVFMGDTRVSTNVPKDDGTRAIGTKLVGDAYDAIFTRGTPYRGEAYILGKPYFTAYDPIKSSDGTTIGVLYVGVQKSVFLTRYNELRQGIVVIIIAVVAVFSILQFKLIKAGKRAEAVQARDLHFLQTLIDSIPNPVYYKDPDGRYLGCNKAFESYIGISRDALVGMTAYDVAPPEIADSYHVSDQELLAAPPGVMQTFEGLLRDMEGNLRNVIFYKARFANPDGSLGGIIGSILDFTDRKRIEDAHQKTLLQQQAILDNIPDIAWLKDPESRYVAANQAFAKACGLPIPEIIGKTDLNIWPHDLAEQYRRDDLAVMESLSQKRLEELLAYPDGMRKWIETIKSPILDGTGQLLGTTGIARDVDARKQAELLLQSSERQLANIIESLPDATWVIDTARRIIAWNQACEELTGYRADDMIGKGDYEYALPFYGERRPILIDFVLSPDPELEQRYVSFERHGDTVAAEIFVPHFRPGMYVWGTARPLYDDSGRIIGAIESIRDITERKHNEIREHSRSEILEHIAKGRPLADILAVIAIAVERECEGSLCSILLANKDATRLIHGSAPSLPDSYLRAVNNIRIGHGIGSCGTAAFSRQRVVVDDIDHHPYWRNFAPVREAGLKSCWSEPVLSSSGKLLGTFAIYFRERRSPAPHEIQLIESAAYFASIAIEHSETEKALRESEHNYRELVENANSIILRMDTTGHITFFNEFAQRFFGYSESEILGQPAVGTIVPEQGTGGRCLEDMIRDICAHPEKYALNENENIKKNGESAYISWSNKACIDESGTLVEILSVGQDITERKRLQEMMVQTEKMMTVGGLAAGMAHELNNPLGAILQNAQNIIRRVSPGLQANETAASNLGIEFPKIHQYLANRGVLEMLQYIDSSVNRAADIVSNLLTFSGKSSSGVETACLTDIVDRAVALAACDYDLKKKYDFRKIKISRDYAEGLPAIPLNPSEIEQVLINLLKNAAQALAATGSEKTPHIILRTRLQGASVILEVEDNGPGIPSDLRTRIFEPFFTTKELGVGTGLGLSVSYSIIVNNHRGMITVDSHPGEGACFRISLPLEQRTRQRR